MNKQPKSILNQNEVNKRILAKDEEKRSVNEMFNISGRYRDEDYAIYLKKRQQFFDSAENYRNLNKTTLNSNQLKLDIDGDLKINYEFLMQQKPINKAYIPAVRTRKRTSRPIYGELQNPIESKKTMEPWLRRFLVLSKFIKVFKTLDVEAVDRFESEGFYVENESYPELFEKFIKR